MVTRCHVLVLICICGLNKIQPGVAIDFVDKLFQLTSQEQVLEDVPYIPFKQWGRAKGVYKSGVKLNFHGPLDMAEARRLLEVFDNNMFATAWVTSTLLEAVQYGAAPKPSDNQLLLAINAFANYHDKNKPYNTSTMSFWPQVYNDTFKYWSCAPDNLVDAFGMMDEVPLPLIEAFLKLIGLGDLVDEIDSLMKDKAMFLQAFHIPPDFDDTFVNIGLGSILYQLRETFPSAWGLWNNQNRNLTSAFDALKKYAYRPFSDDPNLNTIDPRTYFYMRTFLDQAKSQGRDIALVPTWIQTIEELRTDFYLGVGMPFQLNNVDVTVSANTIFGMTSAVLSGLVNPQILNDPVLAQIYLNTSSLLAFEIKTNFSDRPDLALTYYPSQIEFCWFVSRTLAILETAHRKGPFPVPVMELVYTLLKEAAENEMTNSILSKAKSEQTEKVYFDDFLGDGDVTHANKSLVRGEDRIFTTAMAANALIYTWTVYDEDTKTTHWKDGIPDTVSRIIAGSITWLTAHTLDGTYEPWNAFFSGSAKDSNSLPFWYPANVFEYLNGTAISDWSNIPNATFLYGVKGYVPAEDYDAMLKQKHFGYPTPMTFQGYNNPAANFPFWSSVPYTYATTLLAVSRYSNVVG